MTSGDIMAVLPNGAPWLSVAAFAASVVVLEFFDISLPRGDSLGVSGALNSAALVVLGPPIAVAAGLAATFLAFVLRGQHERTTRPSIEFSSVIAGFLSGGLVHTVIEPLTGGSLLLQYGDALATSVAYLVAELVVVQLLVARDSTRSAARLIQGNVYRQAPLLAAQLSACLLAVIIFEALGEPSLVLVVVLLLLIRQSYALLLDIRETYRTTVEVLVEASEGGVQRRGHAERTAALAREIGALCGLRASEIERISYAALLHDIDSLGPSPGGSARVLSGVQSFDEVVRLLVIIEGGLPDESLSESELLAAYVVALASDIDDVAESAQGWQPAVARLADRVPNLLKAKAAAAALRLGHALPALS